MISKAFNKLNAMYKSVKNISFYDNSFKIDEVDFLLFCHDANRGIQLEGKAYSPLIDSLKDEIEAKGLKSSTIAHPWSRLIKNKAYGSPIAINGSLLASKVIKKLSIIIDFDTDILIYERILKKANPKVIITIGSPSALCIAARKLGIFHAEILHGIGYTSIEWGWDKLDTKYLPQCILSLDSVSTKTFSHLEKKGIIIKEISHPFLRRFKGLGQSIPDEWSMKSNFQSQSYNKEILVSLQWGYAPNIDEMEIFKGTLANGLFYEELQKVIEYTEHEVFWRFRLHPVQYTQPDKYRKILDFMDNFVKKHNNCDWRESTFIPLPSVLRHCSGHITMSSMCSYEAAYLGIPTLALGPSLQKGKIQEDLFKDLVNKDYLIKEKPSFNYIYQWVFNVEPKKPLINISDDNNIDTIKWLLKKSSNKKPETY